MESVLAALLDATSATLILALVSLGLAVTFGLVKVINMSHGAIIALGAYLTWDLSGRGLPFVIAVIGAVIGTCLIGLLLEVLIIRHLYERPFETLLITWGVFIVVTEVIKILWGSTLKNLRPPIRGTLSTGGVGIGYYELFVCVVSLLLLVGGGLVLYRTSTGIKVRAMIQNREMALLMGVNAPWMYRSVFVVGSGLAGLAGALLAPMFSIEPDMGTLWLVRSFFVVIVGGLGSLVGGTLVGSILIGGGTALFSLVSKQVFAQTVVFAVAVLVLRFRPTGMLGRK